MTCESCKKEGYADQVIHGVVGGIAGPIMDPSMFVSSEKPRYPNHLDAWIRPDNEMPLV